MSCDVGEVTERLENIALLILQSFRHFTSVTANSPTLPPLYLRNSSFSNPFIASPMTQLVLQPFRRFTYIIGTSLTSPGVPPMAVIQIASRNKLIVKVHIENDMVLFDILSKFKVYDEDSTI